VTVCVASGLNTDVYAFVSPDATQTVTLIANWIPLEAPGGGPNFYKFGDEGDRLRRVRAHERIHIGVVRQRVGRDEWRFAMARRKRQKDRSQHETRAKRASCYSIHAVAPCPPRNHRGL